MEEGPDVWLCLLISNAKPAPTLKKGEGETGFSELDGHIFSWTYGHILGHIFSALIVTLYSHADCTERWPTIWSNYSFGLSHKYTC